LVRSKRGRSAGVSTRFTKRSPWPLEDARDALDRDHVGADAHDHAFSPRAAPVMSVFISRTASRDADEDRALTNRSARCAARACPEHAAIGFDVLVVERRGRVKRMPCARIASPALADLVELAQHRAWSRQSRPFRMENLRIRDRYGSRTRARRCAAPHPPAQARVDEDARHDARPPARRAGHGLLKRFSWPFDVEAAFVVTCQAPSGTSIAISGFSSHAKRTISSCRTHLEIELDVRELAQAPHVLVLDVAPVLAQVHGDAVRAAEVRFHRGPHRDPVRRCGAPGGRWRRGRC
jgi:hypothetical protein